MTTNWTVKLSHGTRTLNLNSGRYKPWDDFVPPPVNEIPMVATGTSANRYGGGSLVGTRAADRTWTFSIRVNGSSDAEVAKGGHDLAAFLALANDTRNPLYLEVRQNSDVAFEPTWGNYGVSRRYEIIHATSPQVWDNYPVSTTRGVRAVYTVTCRLKPYAVGIPQQLASATGGVIEDTIGWADGRSRGLIIPEATTNLFLNPIYGHGTYNNGWAWAAGTSVFNSENTDSRFVWAGLSSVKLTNADGASRVYKEAINVGDTSTYELSCYAKLPTGGAISTTQIDLFYGSAKTTTYTAVGDDGWYRLTASITGIASSQNVGAQIKDGQTVYVDGWQLEQKSYATPLAYGDLLGCSWSGTAHASSSTRTAARARIAVANHMSAGEGTIAVVWRADKAHTDIPAGSRVFEEDTGEMFANWTAATTEWQFTDATQTADNGAATTFAAGDVIVFHFVYNPGDGLIIYKNGSSYATNATYTPPTLGTYIYIGSSDAAALHLGGTFMDFRIYDRAMTAAEVTADYTNIAQLTADNDIVGCIPWLWSVNGDDLADSVLDGTGTSTDSPHTNYVVCGGIPGGVPAITTIAGTLAGTSFDSSEVLLSNLPVDVFRDPGLGINLYVDFGGTSNAASSGGSYKITSSISTTTVYESAAIIGADVFRNSFIYRDWLAGRAFTCFARLYDNGSNLRTAIAFQYNAGIVSDSGFNAPSTTTAFRLINIGSIVMPPHDAWVLDEVDDPLFKWAVAFKRTSGSAVCQLDYAQLLAEPILRILPAGTSSATAGTFIYRGENAALLSSLVKGSRTGWETGATIGGPIELEPNKLNILTSVVAGYESGTFDIQDTLTYTWVKVLPRYAIL